MHQKKLDEMGHLHLWLDKMGLDKMGLDEMGINPSNLVLHSGSRNNSNPSLTITYKTPATILSGMEPQVGNGIFL